MRNDPAMKHIQPIRRNGLRLAVFLLSLVLLAPLGCGSEESKMERGVAVDEEVAVPDSAAEDAMTEAERRAEEDEEEEE